MKIAIVCGHYLPDMGYIEVHLAKAFEELGHQVTVITSTVIPSYVSRIQNTLGQDSGAINIVRLKPVFQLGQVVIAKGIKKAVNKVLPDLVIVIGLGKYFPNPVFDLNFPIISLFGDNAHSYVSDSFFRKLKTNLLFSLFKRGTYRKAIDKSDALLAYTPESFEAAANMVGGGWANTLRKEKGNISLGFWPSEFFCSQAARDTNRANLGWKDDAVIVITATRIKTEKKLEEAISIFENLPENYVWLILGSGEDDYACKLLAEIEQRLGKERVKMLPHQNRNVLNDFYNAADLALYTVPAISIFEALGTGLPVFSQPEKSLTHIPGNGVEMILSDLNSPRMLSLIQSMKFDDKARLARAKAAELRFGWRQIAEFILEAVK